MKGHKGCSSVSLFRMNLAKPVLGWNWSLKGVKGSVRGKLTFPPEETGVISSMTSVCSVCNALEINSVSFAPLASCH